MSGLYLGVDLVVLSVPLAFSWYGTLRFVDRWKDFIPACVVVASGFVAWDVLFTSWGIWGFDDRFLMGPRLAGLPIEEWLFFVCIPYACVFTYHAFGALQVPAPGERTARFLTVGALVVSIMLFALFPTRAYTAVTSGLLAALLTVFVWKRPAWLGRLWLTLAAVSVPFVLSNGVLTGLRFWTYPVLNTAPGEIAGRVVWYDNAHNMGVRLFSIPLDDFLYATLLIGLNVAIMEFLTARRLRSADVNVDTQGLPRAV